MTKRQGDSFPSFPSAASPLWLILPTPDSPRRIRFAKQRLARRIPKRRLGTTGGRWRGMLSFPLLSPDFLHAALGFGLRFRQVGGGQQLGVIVPMFRRFLMSVPRRNGVPDIRLPKILRNAFAIVIHRAEVALRFGVSPARRRGETTSPPPRHSAQRPCRWHILRRDYIARGVSLFGGAAIPLCRLRVIPLNAPAVGIHNAEMMLRAGESLFGGKAIPFHRLRVIPLNTLCRWQNITPRLDCARWRVSVRRRGDTISPPPRHSAQHLCPCETSRRD